MTSHAPLTFLTADPAQSPTVSVEPIMLRAPERGEDLQIRVSAPIVGDRLPVILMAHGFAKSMRDYAPLVDHWTRQGFAVIQPTFLDSATLNLSPDDPRSPDIWRHRVRDMTRILDHLGEIEAAVPSLTGRLDHERIAAVGHSYGAQTVGILLGARVFELDGSVTDDMSDHRIRAGVLLSAAGEGCAYLSPFAAEHFPFMSPSFAELATPALVIAGDKDDSPLSTRGPDWFTDAYWLSPGADALVTLFDGEHLLGGITGYRSADTTDENPERVAAVSDLSTAYLRRALDGDEAVWSAVTETLRAQDAPIGSLQQKGVGQQPVAPQKGLDR
ncbi:MAG: chlorophyllase [Pseudomonadota bacterium]